MKVVFFGKNDERDLRADVNPSFNTARQTLSMLAEIGNENAEKYLELLNQKEEFLEADNENDVNKLLTKEDMERITYAMLVGVESRYEAIGAYFKKSGYQNMLDIACGYVPRAIEVIRDGKDYVGVELPIVAEEMKKLGKHFFENHQHDVYVSGDATNIVSIVKAADMLSGEIFITTEGLIPYLTKSELEQTIEAIKVVLSRHGGAWYSTDMDAEYKKLFSYYIDDDDEVRKYEEARKYIIKKNDVYFDAAEFQDIKAKREFIEKQGLVVEEVPYYLDEIRLKSLQEDRHFVQRVKKMFSKYEEELQTIQKSKEALSEFRIWKMTLAKDAVVEDVEIGCKTDNELDIEFLVREDILECKLKGRIDSLSSPSFLAVFEEAGLVHKLNRVQIDASELEYISSAGLRVLLIMTKCLGEKSVIIHNANAEIIKILETTGFEHFLKVQ